MKAAKVCESLVSLELLSRLVRLNIRVGFKDPVSRTMTRLKG